MPSPFITGRFHMDTTTPASGSTISERENDLFLQVESRMATVLAVLEGMRTYTAAASPGRLDLLDCIRFAEESTEFLWQMHRLAESVIEELDRCRDQKGTEPMR
jgi:hypothetical protein